MADKIWLSKIAYLADIFNKLNELNLSFSFMQQQFSKFWLTVASEYPLLSQKAVKILLPFATTYLCEAGFSALTNLKNKYRSRLAPENDLRVCLSVISPRIDSLCKAKQAHPSH